MKAPLLTNQNMPRQERLKVVDRHNGLMIFSTAMRFLAIGAFATIAAFAADELPKEVPSDALDIEPPLLIKEGPAGQSATSPAPEINVQALEMQLERAKKSAAGADRLYKIGALAKVEAEQRALKVVRLQSDLERARLTQAKEETAKQQSQFKAGEISKVELEAAESAVMQALTTAQQASAKKDNAELEAAVLNLHRQEKLLAVGSGRKSAVNRAQDKIAALKRHKSEEAASTGD